MLPLARQDWPFIAFVAILGIYGLIWTIRMHKRSKALAKLASEIGLTVWDYQILPSDLTLHGTDLENFSKVFNIYQGTVNGVHVVFFDCKVGYGKRTWMRTVLAIRKTIPPGDRLNLDTEISVQESSP